MDALVKRGEECDLNFFADLCSLSEPRVAAAVVVVVDIVAVLVAVSVGFLFHPADVAGLQLQQLMMGAAVVISYRSDLTVHLLHHHIVNVLPQESPCLCMLLMHMLHSVFSFKCFHFLFSNDWV